MEPDTKALYYRFADHFCGDSDLDYLIYSTFATHQEHWICKEHGEYPDAVYERAFDTLYKWDAEHLVLNPKSCIQAYIDCKADDVCTKAYHSGQIDENGRCVKMDSQRSYKWIGYKRL